MDYDVIKLTRKELLKLFMLVAFEIQGTKKAIERYENSEFDKSLVVDCEAYLAELRALLDKLSRMIDTD